MNIHLVITTVTSPIKSKRTIRTLIWIYLSVAGTLIHLIINIVQRQSPHCQHPLKAYMYPGVF